MVYPTIVLVVAVGVTASAHVQVIADLREDVQGLRRRAAAPTQFVIDLSHFVHQLLIVYIFAASSAAIVVASGSSWRDRQGTADLRRLRAEGPDLRAADPQGRGGPLHPDPGHHDLLGRAHPRRAGDHRQDRRQQIDRGRHPTRSAPGSPRARPSPSRWRRRRLPAHGGADDRRRRGHRRHGPDAQQDCRLLRRRGGRRRSAAHRHDRAVLMVFLGGVVGGFLIAMYLPIFTIAGAIK